MLKAEITLKANQISAKAVEVFFNNEEIVSIKFIVAVKLTDSVFLSLSVSDFGIIIYSDKNCGFCITWDDYNAIKNDNTDEEKFLDELIEDFKESVLNECK